MSADVIAWLRSPEGEQWSRDRHNSQPAEITFLSGQWRAAGQRNATQDPCGAGPLKSGEST